jgi:hypothetical protein
MTIRMGGDDIGWTVERLARDRETRSVPVIVRSAMLHELQEHQLLR